MKAARITFLHPDDNSGDKDIDIRNSGHVYASDDRVKVRPAVVPDWFRVGAEIVATDMNGECIDGFVTGIKEKEKPMSTNRTELFVATQYPP